MLQCLSELRILALCDRVAWGYNLQTSNPAHIATRLLLRASDKRPCNRRGANKGDELTPLHSITSSARTIIEGGIVMPSVLAVLRLITSSNLVGCSTGRSAGLAPFAIRSTNSAART